MSPFPLMAFRARRTYFLVGFQILQWIGHPNQELIVVIILNTGDPYPNNPPSNQISNNFP